jgi:hypothetical protein
MENCLKFNVDAGVETSGKIGYFSIKIEIVGAFSKRNSLKIVQQDYTPKIGDKLYFLPGVNIPRVKVKELILDYNISIARDVNNATVIFGGKSTEAKLAESKWLYKVKTSAFKDCVEALKPHLDVHEYDNIVTALEFYNLDYVYSDWQSINFITDANLECYKSSIINPGAVAYQCRESDYLYEVHSEYYDLAKDLEDRIIVHETGLIDKLNSDDAILIDSEVFDQLSTMFKSSDQDNHVIAMEIMANSKYKESLLYIHILFKEYGNVMQNSNTKNHVNFKSLLTYLGKDRYSFSSSLDTIIQSLKDKGVLSVEALDILMHRYASEIIHGGNQVAFKVKSITISDELKAFLNHNYEFKTMAEYTPVVQEEVAQENSDDITPESLTWT